MSPRRRSRRAQWLAAAVVAVLALAAAPAAHADADPASDALLIQDAFYPYSPSVSVGVTQALNQALSEAKAAKFPIKVALIEAQQDLGALTDLYAQPQRYAAFLDREISYSSPVPLLVVMPQGFGLAAVGRPGELDAIKIDQGAGSDGLGRAAIAAVEKLAGDAGHPIKPPHVAAGGGGSGGVSPALAFGAPVALVVIVALVAALRRRRDDGRPRPGA